MAMMMDTTRKQSQRAAYVAYVEVYWRWARLASGDPARTALAEATRQAEARWRALMLPPEDTVLDTTVAAPAPSGPPAQTEIRTPLCSAVSLAAWGD